MTCPRCSTEMVKNMSSDDICPKCGYWSWLEGTGKSSDVIVGKHASYEECVKQEHIKMANRLGCKLSDVYTSGEGRGYGKRGYDGKSTFRGKSLRQSA